MTSTLTIVLVAAIWWHRLHCLASPCDQVHVTSTCINNDITSLTTRWQQPTTNNHCGTTTHLATSPSTSPCQVTEDNYSTTLLTPCCVTTIIIMLNDDKKDPRRVCVLGPCSGKCFLSYFYYLYLQLQLHRYTLHIYFLLLTWIWLLWILLTSLTLNNKDSAQKKGYR